MVKLMKNIFIVFVLIFNSCSIGNKNCICEDSLNPTTLKVDEIRALNFQRIEDDFIGFKISCGDTIIQLNLSNDGKYLLEQRWFFPLYEVNDSTSFYDFLSNKGLRLYNFFQPFDSLSSDSPTYFAVNRKGLIFLIDFRANYNNMDKDRIMITYLFQNVESH